LDQVNRWLTVQCEPPPAAVLSSGIQCGTLLPAGESVQWNLTISCEINRQDICELSYENALSEMQQALQALKADECRTVTSNEQFNAWLNCSLGRPAYDDLRQTRGSIPLCRGPVVQHAVWT
jgi:hypothetical protein